MIIPTAKECRCWRKYPNKSHKDRCKYYDCIRECVWYGEGRPARKTICKLKEDIEMKYNGKEINEMTLIETLRAIADVEKKLGRHDVAEVAERMAEGEEKGMSEDEVIRYALGGEDGE